MKRLDWFSSHSHSLVRSHKATKFLLFYCIVVRALLELAKAGTYLSIRLQFEIINRVRRVYVYLIFYEFDLNHGLTLMSSFKAEGEDASKLSISVKRD